MRDLITLNDGSAIMDGVIMPEYAHDHFFRYQAMPGFPTPNHFFQIVLTRKDDEGPYMPLCEFIKGSRYCLYGGLCGW